MGTVPFFPSDVVATLRRLIARLEGGRPRDGPTLLSSGCGPLDAALPEGGFRRGALVEWLAVGDGAGAVTMALRAAREACREGGALLVLDRCRDFYPPAAARLGIDLERLVVIHAADDADNAWALDQALRSLAVAAVLAWPARLDDRTFRRLQLAAEEGGALGLLVRPAAARHEPSWADVRLEIEPLPGAACRAERRACEEKGTGSEQTGQTRRRRASSEVPVSFSSQARQLRIAVLRCRGGTAGRTIDVEIDDETGVVHSARGLSRFSRAPCAAWS
jgi:hypothetical protein